MGAYFPDGADVVSGMKIKHDLLFVAGNFLAMALVALLLVAGFDACDIPRGFSFMVGVLLEALWMGWVTSKLS